MKDEQLSFLEPIKKPIAPIKKPIKDYASACYGCMCNECIKSAEIYPTLEEKECKSLTELCLNCDNCWYYGMDNVKLKPLIKHECNLFEMSNYYSELQAKRERKNFKILKKG